MENDQPMDASQQSQTNGTPESPRKSPEEGSQRQPVAATADSPPAAMEMQGIHESPSQVKGDESSSFDEKLDLQVLEELLADKAFLEQPNLDEKDRALLLDGKDTTRKDPLPEEHKDEQSADEGSNTPSDGSSEEGTGQEERDQQRPNKVTWDRSDSSSSDSDYIEKRFGDFQALQEFFENSNPPMLGQHAPEKIAAKGKAFQERLGQRKFPIKPQRSVTAAQRKPVTSKRLQKRARKDLSSSDSS